jgi:glycerol-3-phosphate dehydrogenase (NAD(P)+)
MRVGIIGAGAWGTTTGILLADKGHDVTLWARAEDEPERMEEHRCNERFLPSHPFPDRLHVTAGPVGDCDFLVCGVPTQFIRAVFSSLRDELPAAPIVSLAKGIEVGTGKRPTEVLTEVLGEGCATAVLTGPCIAREVARGLPTAVVVAGERAELYQEAFSTDRFRVYTSDDPLGAEMCGALKNVLGIASGIVDGMELGDNTKASLLTRGIVEIVRLGTALGAQARTFYGLAGFGDLFTTCVSPHGRNRTLGERIGSGEKLEDVLASGPSVVEGVPTTRAVLALAEREGVEMPITSALAAILFEGVPIAEAVGALMRRDHRAE